MGTKPLKPHIRTALVSIATIIAIFAANAVAYVLLIVINEQGEDFASRFLVYQMFSNFGLAGVAAFFEKWVSSATFGVCAALIVLTALSS
jgi:hypothetical protein